MYEEQENTSSPEGITIEDLRMEALIDLREMLTDPIREKSEQSETLLETVDIALHKLINEQVINTKTKQNEKSTL